MSVIINKLGRILFLCAAGAWALPTQQEMATLLDRRATQYMADHGGMDNSQFVDPTLAPPKGPKDTTLANPNGAGTVPAIVWSDIDYRNTDNGEGRLRLHILRLLEWTKLIAKGNPTYKGVDLVDQVRKGLNLLVDYRFTPAPGQVCYDRFAIKAGVVSSARPCPINHSVFTTQFKEGQPYGYILLLLKQAQLNGKAKVTDAELSTWAKWINARLHEAYNGGGFHTGGNLAWEGDALISRSLILKDAVMLDSTFLLFRRQSEAADQGHDGVQSDASFSQHGFLYNGGYADYFLVEGSFWIDLAQGLSFGWTADGVHKLTDMVLDGFLPMSQFGVYDPAVIGRVITWNKPSGTDGAREMTNTLLASPINASYRQKELTLAKALMSTSSKLDWPWPERAAKAYWSNDYVTFHQGHSLLSWRIVSKRNVGTEMFDGSNLKGWYLPQGVHWLHRRAFDHALFPVMDWSMLPGLTLDRETSFPYVIYPRGTVTFAGGAVSGGEMDADAGKTAAIGYEYSVSNASITGSKAGFFLDGYCVFLGAGLQFSKPSHVGTTVNQAIGVGEAWLQRGTSAATSLVSGTVKAADLHWVWNDSVGYHFPVPAQMEVGLNTTTGKWSDICDSRTVSPDAVTKPIFLAWFDHGTSATAAAPASFAYAIVTEKSKEEFASWAAKPPYSVEQNTIGIQAVLAQNKSWHGAVFHKAGGLTFSDKEYLGADAPAAVIASFKSDSVYVSVADPTHNSSSIHVVISEQLSGAGAAWDSKAGRTTITFVLPSGNDKGKTIILGFKRSIAGVSDPERHPGSRSGKSIDVFGRRTKSVGHSIRIHDDGTTSIDLENRN